jgi:uncharacterized protein (TIGR03435 family)
MILAAALIAFGPTAAECQMKFEVASIRPTKPGEFTPPNFPLDEGDAYAPTGGRFTAVFPLSVYISFAYKLSLTPEQRQAMVAHLPKWVTTDGYEIHARAAEGNPTKDQMREMMRSLLADRFGLKAHFETQDTPVLALTLVKPGKTGPKLRPHSEGPACDAVVDSMVFPDRCEVMAVTAGRPDHITMAGSRNTTLPLIAGALPGLGRLGRPVVDQTGLTGKFDFTLEWTPEPNGPDAAVDPQGSTFLEALRDQLGLKLESTKAPLKILVVDSVERPTEN